MRFVHTSDWHLGLIFHGLHLTSDQEYALDKLLDGLGRVVREADGMPVPLVVAGDVYDRAVPPAEAVSLLDRLVVRIVEELGMPLMIVAGNHDGARRLEFASALLESRGVHVRGVLDRRVLEPVRFDTPRGPVCFFLLPFAEPMFARALLRELKEGGALPSGTAEEPDFSRPVASLVRVLASVALELRRREGARCVLVTHAAVAGARGCDSERPLCVGGADVLDVSCFEGFDYVALGHYHECQSFPGGRVWYSGSPLKYSFSEASHRKCVLLVDIGGAGEPPGVERVPVPPARDVRRIEGCMEELCGSPPVEGRDDYLEVVLLDGHPVMDAVERLRTVYPNVLSVRQRALSRIAAAPARRPPSRAMTPEDLFLEFRKWVRGEEEEGEGGGNGGVEPSAAHEDAELLLFRSLLEEAESRLRESVDAASRSSAEEGEER